MELNKELITRAIFGIVLCYVFLKAGQFILSSFKKRISGNKSADNDIDLMIKRQEEKLRHQYGLGPKRSDLDKYVQDPHSPPPYPQKLEAALKEASWGGGELNKKIKSIVAKNFSYTPGDSKINSFIVLAKTRNYFEYLSKDNLENQENLAQFLACNLIFHIIVDELKSQDLAVLEILAKKTGNSIEKFQLAMQIKIISNTKVTPPYKDERKFSSKIIINSISEETLQKTMVSIIQKEANLWAKAPSLFFDELTSYLNYSEIIVPLPPFKSKIDFETALVILDLKEEASMDEIKKAYKKKALFFHPDKIGQMKLPPYVSLVANKKFNTIKEAYDMLVSKRS